MTRPPSPFGQDLPMPPPDLIPARCQACGAAYLDNPAGHRTHAVVFGHQPKETAA